MGKVCFNCNHHNITIIDTYKRFWHACNECGCAHSEQKRFYLFSFLPRHYLKNESGINEENIYDYMITPQNAKLSSDDFDNYNNRFSSFIAPFLEKNAKKNILDISGGNGHFLNKFKGKNKNLVLTEFNQRAVDYAQKELGIRSIHYDFNGDSLSSILKKNQINMKFDLIMLRACSMFIEDLDAFTTDLQKILNKDGIIIMTRNVQPTIGTLARTQFDEFSYLFLRQPKEVVRILEKSKLQIVKTDGDQDVYDFYLNYFDMDLLGYAISSYYKFKAILKLRKKAFKGQEKFGFRRRDRQMFYVVATK